MALEFIEKKITIHEGNLFALNGITSLPGRQAGVVDSNSTTCVSGVASLINL